MVALIKAAIVRANAPAMDEYGRFLFTTELTMPLNRSQAAVGYSAGDRGADDTEDLVFDCSEDIRGQVGIARLAHKCAQLLFRAHQALPERPVVTAAAIHGC
jgi:hypothetical protein